jgi:hypothetical protein
MESDMKMILCAIAITATAFAATASLAETAVEDQRANLDKLWGNETTAPSQVASRPAEPARKFTGIISTFRDQSITQWAAGFQGGRVHPPAGN